jgi:hypothetical protein
MGKPLWSSEWLQQIVIHYKKVMKTTWKDKESLWHDVLVFRPYAVAIAKRSEEERIFWK